MLNVGLTGNIAAGKSTVVGLFRRWGATIIDADELVREAETPGSQVLAAIVQRFGRDVLAPDGSLDRAALRAKVMGDDVALKALNAIVHPAVQRRRDELQREALERGDALVVNDIPLLFEALDPAQFAVVVLVDAPDALRRTRLRAMRGLSNDDVDRMLAAQMPATKKRERSQFVIENAGTLAELEARVRTVFRELRRRAAAQALGNITRVPASLLLAAADAKDEPPTLGAIAARYEDAGVVVQRAAGPAAIERATSATPPPLAIVATARASATARAGWEAAGRRGVLLLLSDDPDPVAVRLDLRPWGGGRVALADGLGAGLAPRADVFPPPTD
ncbi:MAG TPA: dephospho-CoA kinase [Gemmatimonadales bacterium]|nr:dephospho-CoA kinase [Gemmatimonadales bacterium]